MHIIKAEGSIKNAKCKDCAHGIKFSSWISCSIKKGVIVKPDQEFKLCPDFTCSTTELTNLNRKGEKECHKKLELEMK